MPKICIQFNKHREWGGGLSIISEINVNSNPKGHQKTVFRDGCNIDCDGLSPGLKVTERDIN